VFSRHPWALYSLQGARIGPNGMRHMEQSLAAVDDAPTDLKASCSCCRSSTITCSATCCGSATGGHKELQAITEFFTTQLATGEYPHLDAMTGDDDVLAVFSRLMRWMSEDARFEAGLVALLDGMERQMAAGPPPTSPERVPSQNPTGNHRGSEEARAVREQARDQRRDERRARLPRWRARRRGEAPRRVEPAAPARIADGGLRDHGYTEDGVAT